MTSVEEERDGAAEEEENPVRLISAYGQRGKTGGLRRAKQNSEETASRARDCSYRYQRYVES